MSEQRQKLPWVLRWTLLKHALQGKLPARWDEWGKTYLVTNETAEAELLHRQMLLDKRQKEWKASVLEQVEGKWSKSQQVQTGMDILRMTWFDNAPTPLVKQIAKQWWLSKPEEARQRSMLDWALFDAQIPPKVPYDVNQFSEEERHWLVGWAIAVREQIYIDEVYRPKEDLQLTKDVPLVTWMSIFNASQALSALLEHHPKQVNRSANMDALFKDCESRAKEFRVTLPAQYFSKGWAPTYYATQWSSPDSLKELCYRGGLANQIGGEGQLSIMSVAVDSVKPDVCEILATHGAYSYRMSGKFDSPLLMLTSKFQPGLDDSTRRCWFNIYQHMLTNPVAIQPLEGTTDESDQLISLAFKTIDNVREPGLLNLIFQEMDKRGISYQSTWGNPQQPEGYQTYFQIALQKESPAYIQNLAGHGVKLDIRKLYQLILLQPQALPQWFETISSTHLQAMLQGTTPKPMTEEELKKASKGNYNWKENWTIWTTALFSIDPLSSFQALLNNPDTEPTLAPHLAKMMQHSWLLRGEAGLAFQRLMKDRFANVQIPSNSHISFSSMLDVSGRSLHAIEKLFEENLVPVQWKVDDQGNLLTHQVVQNQDSALFDIMLKNNVDFDQPNLQGESAMNLAMKINPEWYERLVRVQRERLDQNAEAAGHQSTKARRL